METPFLLGVFAWVFLCIAWVFLRISSKQKHLITAGEVS